MAKAFEGRIFIDSFSSLDDMPKKKRRDPETLLKFFRESGTRRVSTFEMDQHIMDAMNKLEKGGKLEWIVSAYPWHAFRLPTEGKTGEEQK